MGLEIQTALSLDNNDKMIYENLEYFKNIEDEKVKSCRYEWYKSGKKDQLLFKNISAPFTDEQQDAVFHAIRQNLVLKNKAIS